MPDDLAEKTAREIETYEVPDDLVGTTNERGEVIPERLYPVFRDEEELPADADLSVNIERALDASNLATAARHNCRRAADRSHAVPGKDAGP